MPVEIFVVCCVREDASVPLCCNVHILLCTFCTEAVPPLIRQSLTTLNHFCNNISIQIECCYLAQGLFKLTWPPTPQASFHPFLVWQFLLFLFPSQHLCICIMHHKMTVQSIAGSLICLSDPSKSVIMTQQSDFL